MNRLTPWLIISVPMTISAIALAIAIYKANFVEPVSKSQPDYHEAIANSLLEYNESVANTLRLIDEASIASAAYYRLKLEQLEQLEPTN